MIKCNRKVSNIRKAFNINGRIMNILIVIENGQLHTYHLDKKNTWEIGRVTQMNKPDIALHTMTVSRKHGRLENMDGIWFYLDYNGRNGTVCDNKHVDAGLNGRVKPIILKDGDVLILGGGNDAAIGERTVWMMFTVASYDDIWRKEYVKSREHFLLQNEEDIIEWERPVNGAVLMRRTGIAIFMEDIIYCVGDMNIIE